jgi:galactokinase
MMAAPEEWLSFLNSSRADAALGQLYGRRPEALAQQKLRYRGLLERFKSLYPGENEVELFSSPGRSEVGGNHTDHNAGRVLAAALDLDIAAVACRSGDGLITLNSEGYPQVLVDTRQLEPVEAEHFTSAALGRGVCARFAQLHFQVGGFKACLASTIPNGAGLSSSAAYEQLMAVILNELYNQASLEPVLMAQIGQYAEVNYFGKPSGLMDQTTIAVGGLVTIDFKDFAAPQVRKLKYDFSRSGHVLAIVETGRGHTDLTDEYAAITQEMMAVAQALGGRVLRDVPREKMMANLPMLRRQVSDRAILRALHFYSDDQRVVEQVQALESGQFERFLSLVNESGRSSWMLLQNCYAVRDPDHQGIPLALAVTEQLLHGRGAWRVHGGGFGGTIQVFLPAEELEGYLKGIEAVFGQGACHPVSVRPVGATRIVNR